MNITASRLKAIIIQEAKSILKEHNDDFAKYVGPRYDLSNHVHDPKTFAPSSDAGKPDPEAFMMAAKELRIDWSEEEIYTFGKFLGFDAFFRDALLPHVVRFDWDLDRAIELSTDNRSNLGNFFHALWVNLRGMNVAGLLKDLNLPDDGPGLMIDDPGIKPVANNSRTYNPYSQYGAGYDRELTEKNMRWKMLKYLYTARVIRWTGEGFIGPCPMLKRELRL